MWSKRRVLQVDPYIIDTLMPDLVGHDRHPAAFLVFLYLWSQAVRSDDEIDRSLLQISAGTGLSRRTVQSALDRLRT